MPSEQALLSRIRGEYREMPGLRLTIEQACRLWQIESPTCLVLLEQLVHEGTLYRRGDGAYCSFPSMRPKPARMDLGEDPPVHTKRRA